MIEAGDKQPRPRRPLGPTFNGVLPEAEPGPIGINQQVFVRISQDEAPQLWPMGALLRWRSSQPVRKLRCQKETTSWELWTKSLLKSKTSKDSPTSGKRRMIHPQGLRILNFGHLLKKRSKN